MVYIYEALCLVLSSMILGTSIGLLMAIALTLQFDLFTEMVFKMDFPHAIFWTMAILAIFVAIVGSAFPAYSFLKKSISDVLRRN
jgi:ABC-type antimicrobial peptide transport system permease subunit